MTNTNGALPELMVEPEGLDISEPAAVAKSGNGVEDPLLDLFRKKTTFRLPPFKSNCASKESPVPKPLPTRLSKSIQSKPTRNSTSPVILRKRSPSLREGLPTKDLCISWR